MMCNNNNNNNGLNPYICVSSVGQEYEYLLKHTLEQRGLAYLGKLLLQRCMANTGLYRPILGIT